MEYNEKVSKAKSDEFSTLSTLNQGEGDLAKLKNQFQNYSIRSGFYYVTAPRSGQITRTVKAGIGEVVKEYELLVAITPGDYHVAVEMYVKPVDLPLISEGQLVAFQFDGWPAIFFSGWPKASYGTFFGNVVAIANAKESDGSCTYQKRFVGPYDIKVLCDQSSDIFRDATMELKATPNQKKVEFIISTSSTNINFFGSIISKDTIKVDTLIPDFQADIKNIIKNLPVSQIVKVDLGIKSKFAITADNKKLSGKMALVLISKDM